MREKNIKLMLTDNLQNENSNYAIISKYLLNSNSETELKLKKIAFECYTSVTTVERFVKKLGFKNFVEFKVLFIEELRINKIEVDNNIPDNRIMYWEQYHKFIDMLSRQIDYELIENFAKELLTTRKIKCIALGSSSLITQDFEQKFDRLGLNIKSYSDINLAKMAIRNLDSSSIVLAVSYSGYTKEIIELLEMVKTKGVKTALITSNENLVNDFDSVFLIPKVENYQRSGTMYSRILMLNIIDLIYVTFNELNPEYTKIELKQTNYFN